ncbi:MAG: hypothetical protein MUP15_10685, partial [Dehalococcoidia bacterium]|nr:hypothetical protein [Dehalococcoidia bacterium]
GNVVSRVCETAAGMDLAAPCKTSLEGSGWCVNVEYPTGHTSGSSVIVTAEYHYKLITPLASIMKLVSGGSFSDGFDLSSSSDMRLE